MKVYILGADEKCGWLTPADEDVWDDYLRFDGKRKGTNYSPLEVEFAGYGQLRDIVRLGVGAPVFSKRAVDMLKPIMGSQVEVLPLKFKSADYFLINVTNVLDCMDYTESKFVREPVLLFQKYAFVLDKISEWTIFKTVEEVQVCTFVTDRFVGIVKGAELSGFEFKLVWESDVN